MAGNAKNSALPARRWKAAAMRGLRRVYRHCRQADWLDAARATIYGRLLAATMLICALGMTGWLIADAAESPQGRPFITDFDAFWSGARLAAEGRPAEAYQARALMAMEKTGARIDGELYYPYMYPPVFMLITLPLAKLSYLWAMAAFVFGGYATLIVCLRLIIPYTWPLLSILALPAAVTNMMPGQNGFLSATCFAAAMLLLERWPVLAGMSLGVLVYKPHLALCVPVVLMAARRWTALVACGATAASLVLISWAVLGSAAWHGFFGSLRISTAMVQSVENGPKQLSFFGGVRLLTGSFDLSVGVQLAATLICLGAIAGLSARRPGARPEVAMMAAAACLCTPYIMDYDLVILAVPMAWLAAEAAPRGWRPWEKLALGLAYLLPLVARSASLYLNLPLAPPIITFLLIVILARIAAGGGRAAPLMA